MSPGYHQTFLLSSLVVLIALIYSGQSQVLSGNIESIQFFPSCDQSPLADSKNPKNWINHNNPLKTTQSFCQAAGAKTNVTAIRMTIQSSMVDGAETLSFTVPSLPTAGIINRFPSNVNGKFPCSEADKLGIPCVVLDQALNIKIKSSQIAAMYQLLKRYNLLLYYGMTWFQCDDVTDITGTPSSGLYGYTQWSPPSGCSAYTQKSYTNHLNDPASNCASSPRGSLGAVFNLENGDVCPYITDPTSKILDYYVNPSYTPLSTSCASLMCPNNAGFWNFGVARSIQPVCEAYDINPSPRSVANVGIDLSYVRQVTTTDPVTGLSTTEEVETFVTELKLGTLQNGYLQTDPLRILSGEVLNFLDPYNGIAQELQGTIIACNKCTENADGKGCTMEPVSDIPQDSDLPSNLGSNGFLAATTNPWTYYADRLDGCVLPSAKCHQKLKKDPDSASRWSYRNLVESFNICDGCNCYGMPDDAYARDSTIATIMCQAGMQGACIPGYQQVFEGAKKDGVATQCETEYGWAYGLSKTPLTNFAAGNGMPDNFDIFANNYWMDRIHLFTTPEYGTTDSGYNMDIVYYMIGNFTGVSYNVAKGSFVKTGMTCSVTDGGTVSDIAFNVYNNDTIAGGYFVKVNFTIPPSAPQGQFDMAEITTATFQLEPGQNKSGLFSDVLYQGPYSQQLIANYYLFSTVVTSYSPGGQLLAYANSSCGIQGLEGFVNIFGAATANPYALANDLPSGGGGGGGNQCEAYQIYCWEAGDHPVWFWIKKTIWILIYIAIAIPIIIGLVYLVYIAYYSYKRRKYNRATDEYVAKEKQLDKSISELKGKLKNSNLKSVLKEHSEGLKAESGEMVEPSVGESEEVVGPSGRVTNRKKKGKRTGEIVIKGPGGRLIRHTLYSNSILMIIACLFMTTVMGEVLVLKVFQDRTCTNTSGSPTGLNCSAAGFSTRMDLKVTANVEDTGTSQLIESAQGFEVQLTVIPFLSNQTQFGNGTHCQTQPCQLTIPARMTIEMMRPKERWRLEPIFTPTGSQAYTPYVFYFNSATSTNITTTGSDPNGNYECNYSTFTFDSSTTSQQTKDPDHTEFNDPTLNSAHFQCPVIDSARPARPGKNINNLKRSELQYGWRCKSKISGKTINPVITNEFYSMTPTCGIYRIVNPPELVTGIRINISINALNDNGVSYSEVLARMGNLAISDAVKQLLTVGHNETLTIQSIQQGFNGAFNVSLPYHLVSAQIISSLSPSDIHGTYLPGVIVSCRDNPADPTNTLVDMSVQTKNRDGFFDAFRNPWKGINPQQGALLMPIPENINQMQAGAPDPYSMFYYLNETKLPWVGQGCNQLMANPDDLYGDPGSILNLDFLRNSPSPILYKDLVPVNQGGTGKFQTMLTCVPGFCDISPLGTKTACKTMSDMTSYQNILTTLGNADVESILSHLPVPDLPWIWNVFLPNMWIYMGYLWHDPIPGSALASTGYEIDTDLSGQYVAPISSQAQSNVSQSPSQTFCTIFVDEDQNVQQTFNGDAYYRVCDSNFEQAGSYDVNVECGFLTQYVPELDIFDTNLPLLTSAKATVSTHPSNVNIPALPPNTCASLDVAQPVSINGAMYNVPNDADENALNQILLDQYGRSQMICRYRIYLAGSVYPRTTLASNATATCNIKTTTNREVLNPAGTLGPEVSPFPSGTQNFIGPSVSPEPDRRSTPFPTPTSNPNAPSEALKVSVWLGVGLVFAFIAICFIAVCVDVRRRT